MTMMTDFGEGEKGREGEEWEVALTQTAARQHHRASTTRQALDDSLTNPHARTHTKQPTHPHTHPNTHNHNDHSCPRTTRRNSCSSCR